VKQLARDLLAAHLQSGRTSSGIFIAREPLNAELARFLVLIAFASGADEWRDRITFIP
jgi:hypothetical protein